MQLIKHIQHRYPMIAIIVLGSGQSPPNAVASLQAGAADFMVQPVDVEELMARIERHVQRQVSTPGPNSLCMQRGHGVLCGLADSPCIQLVHFTHVWQTIWQWSGCADPHHIIRYTISYLR